MVREREEEQKAMGSPLDAPGGLEPSSPSSCRVERGADAMSNDDDDEEKVLDEDDDEEEEEDDDDDHRIHYDYDDSDSDQQEQDRDPGTSHDRRRGSRRRRSRRRRGRRNDLPSHDDPYTYSDDSASLSDAYFFPTDDDLALPPRYRTERRVGDPQQQLQPLTLPLRGPATGVPTSPPRRDYGSMMAWNIAGEARGGAGASAGANLLSNITEDGPDVTSAAAAATAAATATAAALPPSSSAAEASPPFPGPAPPVPARTRKAGRGNRQWRSRRERKEAQQRRVKQMRQMARERAVAQVRGTPQDPSVWRDPAFAVLFGAQLVVVLAAARIWGAGAVQLPPWTGPADGRFHWQQQPPQPHAEEVGVDAAYSDDASRKGGDGGAMSMDAEKQFALDDVVTMVAITGFYSFILTFVSFGCMLILARTLLQVLLLFSILLSLTWAIVGLTLDPYGTISMAGFLSVLLTLGCTVLNWSRIRFASTNLFTALCGIRSTADAIVLGLAGQVVAFAWCVVWSVALVGALARLAKADCVQVTEASGCAPRFRWEHVPVYLLYLFSFMWTNAVIKNVVQVAVAGAFGAWWCHPQEVRPFCTLAVGRPLIRAVTTSFGSVCLGSLVVNPAQLALAIGGFCCSLTGIRRAAARRSSGWSGIASTTESVGLGGGLGTLRTSLARTLRSCNRWTFTYIGLYGYGFREAGERAVQLFETREWLEVVQDNLVPNVLSMACFVVGGSSGTFAVVFQGSGSAAAASSQIPTFVAFFTGSVVGYVLSTCLLHGLIGSSVNGVLVCFASHPFEFDVNHQWLSKGLRDVWSRQVWESHA